MDKEPGFGRSPDPAMVDPDGVYLDNILCFRSYPGVQVSSQNGFLSASYIFLTICVLGCGFLEDIPIYWGFPEKDVYLLSGVPGRFCVDILCFRHKKGFPAEDNLEGQGNQIGEMKMRIIHLPPPGAILLCFILWALFQLLAVYICLRIPDRYFRPNSFLYKSHKWEADGEIYRRIFKVNRWKKYLPDGGKIMKNGYGKRKMQGFSRDHMEKFLTESCRGEAAHILAILPFWVFGLFSPGFVVPIMLVYSLAVNTPCIIAQRYNRPRIIKLMNRGSDPHHSRREDSGSV